MSSIVNFFTAALAWCQANPTFTALVLWPIITAIFTAVFRHRTPLELASLPTPLRYVVRVIAYVGFDSASLLAMLRGRMFPTQKPSAPPEPRTPPPAILGVLIALMLAFSVAWAILIVACGPATPSPEAVNKAAETDYTGRLVLCVQENDARASIDSCRCAVDTELHIDGGNCK